LKTNPDSRRMDRVGMERRRSAEDGFDALSCVFSVLCPRGQALLPALINAARTCFSACVQIASYALLTLMIAQCAICSGRIHPYLRRHALYLNHLEQGAHPSLARAPRTLPRMRINPGIRNLFDFKYGDFALEDYDRILRSSAGCGLNRGDEVQRISLLVAMARNPRHRARQRIPWHLPADLKRFQSADDGSITSSWAARRGIRSSAMPGRTTVS
jgi:hypothetical protein